MLRMKVIKKEAEEKLNKLKNKKPHIAVCIEGIDINSLRRYDYKMIKDLDRVNFGNYENNLREYFRNKTRGKEKDLTIIENDSRFKCYCVLKEALNLGTCRPEEFIK